MLLPERDLANVLWVVLVVGILFAWPNTRGSFPHVVRALFAMPIVIALGTLTLYIGLCIYGFAQIGLWRSSDWALTLLWLVGSAFLSTETKATRLSM